MILSMAKSPNEDEGQSYILEINKKADDIPYARLGKRSLPAYSFTLRNATPNGNKNKMEKDEVEKDLDIKDIMVKTDPKWRAEGTSGLQFSQK